MKSRRGNHGGANRGAGRVRVVAKANLPTQFGRFTILGIEGLGIEGQKAGESAVALVRGRLNGGAIPLVRIHSQCLTGDVLGSLRCDCRAQLEFFCARLARLAPESFFIFLRRAAGSG